MRIRRPIRVLATLGLVTMLAGGCRQQINDSDLRYLSGGEVATLLDPEAKGHRRGSHVLVDPRDAKAFEGGHLPGAVNFDVLLPDRTVDPVLSKAGVVVVYGRNAGDALARGMAKRLMSLGLKNVYLYPGGLDDWTRRGGQAETGSAGGPR